MRWWFCVIGGIGDCLLETDFDLDNSFESGDCFEAHKLTVVVVNPATGQVGYARHMASNPAACNGSVKIKRDSIILFAEARDQAVKDMARVWEEKRTGIALPTMDDIRKLKQT